MRQPGRRKPRPRLLITPVAGVTFEGRQSVIRKHCRKGDAVRLEREPLNPHSKDAVAVWVRKRAWFFKGWAKAGYIPKDRSPAISRLIDEGWACRAHIEAVVGGGPGMNWGLRLEIELNPPDRDR